MENPLCGNITLYHTFIVSNILPFNTQKKPSRPESNLKSASSRYARLGRLEVGLRPTWLDLVRLETKSVSCPPSSVVLFIEVRLETGGIGKLAHINAIVGNVVVLCVGEYHPTAFSFTDRSHLQAPKSGKETLQHHISTHWLSLASWLWYHFLALVKSPESWFTHKI